MKKILKLVLLTLLAFYIGYVFLLSNYNPMFKNDYFTNLTQTLEEVQKEDLSSFTKLYNKIHESDQKRICPCDRVTKNVDPFRHQISLVNKIYSLKIKKDFTHDDCLKYYLLYGEFLQGNIGIKNASNYYFRKTVEELNEKEKITLLVMLENPNLYNPKRRKKLIDRKVQDYQNLLD